MRGIKFSIIIKDVNYKSTLYIAMYKLVRRRRCPAMYHSTARPQAHGNGFFDFLWMVIYDALNQYKPLSSYKQHKHGQRRWAALSSAKQRWAALPSAISDL